jgi:tryptophanyl-tRNA synthetase
LIDALIAHLSPITTKLNHLLADQAYLNKILSENTQKARAVAAPVLSDTMKIMGF